MRYPRYNSSSGTLYPIQAIRSFGRSTAERAEIRTEIAPRVGSKEAGAAAAAEAANSQPGGV